MARNLNANDIGKVFIRVDQTNDQQEFLLLRSIGTGQNQIFSFITFNLEEGNIDNIGDTGYINGPWYEPVDSVSHIIVDQINHAYDLYVKQRLIDVRIQNDLNTKNQARYRSSYSKPNSWILLHKEELEDEQPLFYILWMDEEKTQYIIEIYNEEEFLLGKRVYEWNNPPRFGMSFNDVHSIFGENGILEELVNDIIG